MATEPVIQVCDLVKRFGDQVVLDGVNLDVHPGDLADHLGTDQQ